MITAEKIVGSMVSAADLKFLPICNKPFQELQIESGTRIIDLPCPLLPKFVSEGAAIYHELRKRGMVVGGHAASIPEIMAKKAKRRSRAARGAEPPEGGQKAKQPKRKPAS